jgi:RNA polymerase sigma-70 factor, ECF subfamily
MTPLWETLVRENTPMVFGVAWRILKNSHDAEDVGQEVFLELHHMLKSRRVENCPSLLRRLAVLRSLDRLRQRKGTAPLDESIHAAAEPSPDEEMVRAEEAGRIRRALARLPRQMGAVFCLRYFEDLSNLQIADALGISASAVSTAINKAKTRLERRMLGDLKSGVHDNGR